MNQLDNQTIDKTSWSWLDLIGQSKNKPNKRTIEVIYPVGAIYISTLSTNPSTLFGFGTWTAFGAGRTLVGLDAGQTEFDTVEETGGSKTHTLTSSEMPAHTHAISLNGAGTNPLGPSSGAGADDANYAFTDVTFDVTAGVFSAESTGGGTAHNNLQPYIVCYFWKRTA